MSSADPLSFFAGEDSSSSESEAEGGEEVDEGLISKQGDSTDPNRLPPPDSLFATVKPPSFLTDPSKKHLDWDCFVKNDTEDTDNIHLSEGGGNYAAIAPPSEGDSGNHNKKVHSSLSAAIVRTYSNTGGEISAPPVRYSTNEVDAKFRTVSDRSDGGGAAAEVGEKRAGPDGGDETVEAGTKKLKTENFRQKEKRKRNLGQTSRGKNYVEEEKRVLRQQFATDEIMN